MSRPELVNIISPLMPEVIITFDRASGSRTKGKTRAITLAEATEMAQRNGLRIIGACWYDEEHGSYSHYVAVDKLDELYLCSLIHGRSSWQEAAINKMLDANPGKVLEDCDWITPITREEEKSIPLEYNMIWAFSCCNEGPFVFSDQEAEYQRVFGQFLHEE